MGCGYEGATFHLQHLVGLQHLARLVAAGGSELHVLDLAAGMARVARTAAFAQDVLDPTARAAYRQRVTDLREDLDEAEANNDYERADRLGLELDTIIDELHRAVGLAGRIRPVSDDAERARIAVRKAITVALDRLAEHDTSFAQHLRIHIRTGSYCRYELDPTTPIDWDITP